eukprot:scaffold60365_cov25-Cyclotella_meneghiniana.AAC.1
MTLPRPTINSIKTNLSDAVSSKNPQAVANAIQLPPLHRRTNPSDGAAASDSTQTHQQQLKIDGADWSPVLNSLLDCHAAISS